MKFIDEVVIYTASGAGGPGAATFRREKHVPRGGPDGGDGGDGGGLVFEATRRRNTLVDYRRKRHWRAANGVPGNKNQMHGANGADLVMMVPVGTSIYDDETGELLADLDEPGVTFRIDGGKGGLGNVHFKSSTNRTPRKAQPGLPGQEHQLRLELKLLADLGLLGFPNAGKSTFLGTVSAARPKVADYPFTTLVPQLGVVRMDDETSFVLADIPGLIEGAADGAGLGHRFLKHVERCAGYIHLVSASPHEERSPVERYQALNDEVSAYGAELFQRPQLVCLSQVDTLDPDTLAEQVEALQAVTGSKVFPISSVTGEGVPEVVRMAYRLVRMRRDADADRGQVDT